MARKWFQLVGEIGNALTSTDAVVVDIEDVAALRKAVFKEIFRALPATVIAADLTFVDPNGAALPNSWSLVEKYGNGGEIALIVKVPKRVESDSSYFIQPNVQEQVENAVFVIVDKDGDHKGVGMGVFFSSILAVTCHLNLTEQHTVGSVLSLALKNGNPDELRGRCDVVLASYRLGIDEKQDVFKNQLNFAPVAGISISAHRRHLMYSCPTYAGDSGAALLIKDGLLVGIHQETINALHEEMDRRKTIKDRLNDVEESLDNIARSGIAQGCLGLLVHEFKDVVSG